MSNQLNQQRPNQFFDGGSPLMGQNVPKDEAIFKNPESFNALKKINSSPKDLHGQLMN